MATVQPNREPPATVPPLPVPIPSVGGNPALPLSCAIPPGILRSQEAFRRDLPQLLQNKRLFRQWVAYHEATRIGIAPSEDDLYEECFRRGLREEEFVVCCIVPELPRDIDVAPPHEV